MTISTSSKTLRIKAISYMYYQNIKCHMQTSPEVLKVTPFYRKEWPIFSNTDFENMPLFLGIFLELRLTCARIILEVFTHFSN